MAKLVAGIDPGVTTGLALWDTESQALVMCMTTTILEAMHQLEALLDEGTLEAVNLEDARMIGGIGNTGFARAQGAGSVKRDCRIWEEWAERYGVRLNLISPKHKGAKMNPVVFGKVFEWDSRTSQHARDAAMIASMRA
jgi:hypothetical protein